MDKCFTEERRVKLLQMIKETGSIRIKEMAKFFNVTTETIRKDFLSLDDKGLIEKTHGGAIAIRGLPETPISRRFTENLDEKTKIAQKAQEYIFNNSTIIIDSGSTLLRFSELLPNDKSWFECLKPAYKK